MQRKSVWCIILYFLYEMMIETIVTKYTFFDILKIIALRYFKNCRFLKLQVVKKILDNHYNQHVIFMSKDLMKLSGLNEKGKVKSFVTVLTESNYLLQKP